LGLQRFTRGGWVAGRRNKKRSNSGDWNDNDRNFSEYLRLRGYDTVKGTEIDKLEKSMRINVINTKALHRHKSM